MKELDDFINKVTHLPPAPKVVPQLIQLLREPDTDSSRIVQLITYDPGLTAGVLRACNSAFYGASTPAENLDEAVTRLGFGEIFKLVVAISGSRALAPAQPGYGIDQGELWKHSVTSAIAAQLIAQDLGEDQHLAFTGGLLHDIGKIVLAQALERIYEELINRVTKHQQALLDAEKELLGVQHAEIGGRLLARWKFPASISSSVWWHHQPSGADPYGKLASMIYLGNMIAYFIGHGYGYQAFALRGRSDALEILGLRGDDLPRFMIRTYEHFEAVEALVHVCNA